MSAPIKDGGPAFPIATDFSRIQEGMTLRDYFAAAALQGMIACEEVRHKTFRDYARVAYKQADAMVAQRARKEAKP